MSIVGPSCWISIKSFQGFWFFGYHHWLPHYIIILSTAGGIFSVNLYKSLHLLFLTSFDSILLILITFYGLSAFSDWLDESSLLDEELEESDDELDSFFFYSFFVCFFMILFLRIVSFCDFYFVLSLTDTFYYDFFAVSFIFFS